jgi:hypothetical protein
VAKFEFLFFNKLLENLPRLADYSYMLLPVLSSLVVLGSMSLIWAGEDAAREVVILQIKVLEGDGAIHAAGSKAGRGVTVQVSDEIGKPVSGAAVSFRLPDEGPGGLFRNGLRTEIVVTGPDGLASVKGMRWNTQAGPFELRVVAAKDRARAGVFIPQYLSGGAALKAAAGR